MAIKVTLLTHTPNPEQTVAMAAKLCYSPSGIEDIREGLTAIISIKIADPQFEGQTKQKLGNTVARGAVDSIVSEQLTYFLEQNPAVAKSICEKSLLAQRAREAARYGIFSRTAERYAPLLQGCRTDTDLFTEGRPCADRL